MNEYTETVQKQDHRSKYMKAAEEHSGKYADATDVGTVMFRADVLAMWAYMITTALYNAFEVRDGGEPFDFTSVEEWSTTDRFDLLETMMDLHSRVSSWDPIDLHADRTKMILLTSDAISLIDYTTDFMNPANHWELDWIQDTYEDMAKVFAAFAHTADPDIEHRIDLFGRVLQMSTSTKPTTLDDATVN